MVSKTVSYQAVQVPHNDDDDEDDDNDSKTQTVAVVVDYGYEYESEKQKMKRYRCPNLGVWDCCVSDSGGGESFVNDLLMARTLRFLTGTFLTRAFLT